MFKCKIGKRVLILLSVVVLTLQSCHDDRHREDANQKPIEVSESADKGVPVVAVTSGTLRQDVELPAELRPFRDVKIHAKIKGFVSWIGVDRGSKVKRGQVLIKLSAPEIDAQVNELKARVVAAQAAHAESISTLEADRAGYVELKARLDADSLTLERLRKASKEPGAIAQNEIDTAQKTAEGDQARLKAAEAKIAASESVVAAKLQAVKAADNSLDSVEATREYLVIRSPLDGVITERWVHEGDMAGVEASRAEDARPLLRLFETTKLRLVVSVPESEVAGIREGQIINFTVPAFLGRQFHGTVSRIGHSLDVQTRTMPVELDVNNQKSELEPGMYATVDWHVKRPYETLFVPVSSVVGTMEGTFVVSIVNGVTNKVSVSTGQTMGDRIEIVGPIEKGSFVLLKGTDEYKSGMRIATRPATAGDIAQAGRRSESSGGE